MPERIPDFWGIPTFEEEVKAPKIKPPKWGQILINNNFLNEIDGNGFIKGSNLVYGPKSKTFL